VPSTNKKPAQTPRQIAALAEICRQHLLAEKWLLTPSRRIGQQWLDQIARAGQPVVNIRLHTPASLALELAGPRLEGRRLLSPLGRVVLAGRLLRQLDAGYLGGLRPSLALAERLAATLHDLRLAGLEPDDLERGRFEAPAKGRELIALLRAYRQMLDEHKLVDDAELFRLAGTELPAGVLVLAPADLDLGPLQKIPHTILPVDEPPAPDFTDAFNAVGETNEVREVLRRCLANGWPLDQVEVLHTDAETYVARFYELAAALDIPVTFAEGVPVRYSRPGRALAAWLAWVAADFPQPALVAMIRDGLLEGLSGNLAGALRVVPIGFGRDRYLAQLDEQCAALERQAAELETDEAGEPRIEHRAALQRRRDALAALRAPVAHLLALADRPLLDAADEFLKNHARCVNELDNYAREVLQMRLTELKSWLPAEDEVREWLPALLRETRVVGEGPRPGHLYVTGWERGGHSGRPHTFLVGLDADRFPPSGRQDPVLLDSERKELSPELATVAGQRERTAKSFQQLRARLRGTVTGSYSCRNVADDSEWFAGLALPAPTTAATAPATEAAALSENEWWLWRLCATKPVREAAALVGECFPWLGRGMRATFDGFVPAAGPDLDPAVSADRQFSPHRLETVGTCPLRYFYRYALGLQEPEELELDPERWLPPAEFGQLLHEVFCRHLRDGVALEQVLQERIARYREKFPPPNEGVLRRDCRRLERAIRIFAAEAFDGTPVDFEREISGVPVALPDGSTIHLRGRIDRVDETAAGLELWDYKTGSTFRFRTKRDDPFNGGRVLQHAIYIELAKARYGRPVARFGYFFPTEKGRGERLVFTPAQLAGAPELLARLRGTIARGEFPATEKLDDCTYCDYRSICRR
jgi:ATP-dependent helicase/nuclease subunit B